MLYYLAYGSNLDPARFARYDPSGRSPSHWEARSTWVEVAGARYFAGRGRAWGGAVAFLSVWGEGAGDRLWCRAYRVVEAEFRAVLRGENGYPDLTWPAADLPQAPGAWRVLPIPLSEDGLLGKYDVVLRLPDVGGLPCLTITTSRLVSLGIPTAEYVATIERGGGGPLEIGPAAGDNARFLPPESRRTRGAAPV